MWIFARCVAVAAVLGCAMGYLPPFPLEWDAVNFSALPVDSGGRVQLDPWNYTHRLAMVSCCCSEPLHSPLTELMATVPEADRRHTALPVGWRRSPWEPDMGAAAPTWMAGVHGATLHQCHREFRHLIQLLVGMRQLLLYSVAVSRGCSTGDCPACFPEL